MNNFEDGNLGPCDVCNMSKWGIEMDEQGSLAPYCTVCSGDYMHTKEARDAAAKLNQ
jgi:hypothetical protein